MLKRTTIAALIAGMLAGLVLAVLTHWRLMPLIAAAEGFEQHDHSTHDHISAAWSPAEGFERTVFTVLTCVLSGVGFAALLAGAALLLNLQITKKTGLIMGLCGFFAVSLAPAIGLPPALPGMPDAPFEARQIWWLGTIAATAAGLYALLIRREKWALPAALLVIALPHVIGVPQPSSLDTPLPAPLAAAFVANSLMVNLIFWCMIGYLLGLVNERHQGT